MIKQIVYTIVSFLVIDIIWIQLVVNKQYKKLLPDGLLLEKPNLAPAILFYLLFCLSLWFLVIRNHNSNTQKTLLNAFIFGVTTYATYSLTNLSIISGWNWTVAIADTIWGGVLAVLVSFIVIHLP